MNAWLAAEQERRTFTRNKYEAPIQYENGDNGIFYPAKMLNYSEEGMYFETAIIHRPGDEIYIDFDFSPYAENLEGHRAEVMWCIKIAGKGAHGQYGVGVKYFETIQ
jgi:hypothetical protein